MTRRGLRCPCGASLRCQKTTYENGTVVRLRQCENPDCGRWYRSEERLTELTRWRGVVGVARDLFAKMLKEGTR